MTEIQIPNIQNVKVYITFKRIPPVYNKISKAIKGNKNTVTFPWDKIKGD